MPSNKKKTYPSPRKQKLSQAQKDQLFSFCNDKKAGPVPTVSGYCTRCGAAVKSIDGIILAHKRPDNSAPCAAGGAKSEHYFTTEAPKQEDEPDPTAGDAAKTVGTGTASVAASKLPSGLASKLVKPIEDTSPHLIVEARAGTGKTTTLVEGIKIVMGLESKLTPSPQQQAVWDCMALSKDKAKSICFCAFNNSIAEELKTRVPKGAEAMTLHSLGYRAVRDTFPGLREPNKFRVQNIIEELTGINIRDLRKTEPVYLKAVEELVGLCKQNLVAVGEPDWKGGYMRLEKLASHYDVELNGCRDKVFALVPRVLERCKDVAKCGYVDFNDMIWLPIVLQLPVKRYDLLLVDEAQDLNRCQQELAKRAGKRLILCGDPKQAIYGFAGADSESMPRMHEELANGVQLRGYPPPANGRGCITLPLTVTRRCGKAIVEEARQYCPEFSAHESNPDGKVSQARYPEKGKRDRQEIPWEQSYGPSVQDGDFILCRTNAPLVSQCFRFIALGKKANIQGRDIGTGLVSTVKKLSAPDPTKPVCSLPELVGRITDWSSSEQAKEQAKKNPSDNKVQAIQDRAACLLCFTEGSASVEDVLWRIGEVFTDGKPGDGIRLSSVHKSKGLEAKRVYFIQAEGTTGPPRDKLQPWEREQCDNLCYVAITRAIEELIFVI